MPDQLHTTAGHGRRRQEVGPEQYADEVYARSALDAAIALGRAYLLGTGRVQLAVAGNVRVQLLNPAGSGVILTLLGLGGLSTATGFAQLFRDPTTGIPATAARPALRLNNTTGQAPAAQLRVDTNTTTPLSGGTDTGVVLGFPGGSRVNINPLGLVLAPGQAIGINAAFAGSADLAASLYVTEEVPV